MTREKLRLNMWDEAERHRLSEERVSELVPLALLIGDKDRLAAGICEHDGSIFEMTEITCRKLTAIDQCESDAICQNRPQFLHQVERQARPTRAVAMQKA